MQDLNTPLRPPRGAGMRRISVPWSEGVIALAFLVALVAGLWIALIDDPYGGQPRAVAAIEDTMLEEGRAASGRGGILMNASRVVEGEQFPASTVGDERTGMKMLSLNRPPETRVMKFVDKPRPDLLEATVHGQIPKISLEGLKPMQAYARPAKAGSYSGKARVVIIVGGMGLSQTGTLRAIDTLPADVTLAFAPYGSSLSRWVSRARQAGHEILLQLPLEPHGYPVTNPGRNTLLVSSDGSENADRLHWHLSRIDSYTGVMGFMGSRFLTDPKAMTGLLTELRDRGLFFVDEGVFHQSVAPSLAARLDAPSLTASVRLDRIRREDEIVRQLNELAKIARRDGVAIGTASAFPQSVEIITKWIEAAEQEGIAVVPASGLLPKGRAG